MSQTSVGSGTPNDRNENPASDGYPSKTFGAESGPPEPAAPGAAVTAPKDPSVPSPEDAFPDGPNVAPSPWELDAAKGQPDPQDPAPDTAADL